MAPRCQRANGSGGVAGGYERFLSASQEITPGNRLKFRLTLAGLCSAENSERTFYSLATIVKVPRDDGLAITAGVDLV